ncbi:MULTISPECIES: signal recognition particle-docking protein FtsY [unclassified Pyramidobacter]|uniref:signal recognition particle-docking protein FtsY n=1 Tax=unclassified Pyramidobacter TaxID=2632171 RepID=UPI000EA0884D|nr:MULTISPECIES: signal recognition particle-docking protein FtsY [unclassified Pyramidobacter]RKJ80686.1 signal recognition particle-docking protein FtsY [Pyramidobacter sp. CG50-2]WOL41199.1 signal recognition particle-docking protein FtsY [Pyramidobacter sp. YE332]
MSFFGKLKEKLGGVRCRWSANIMRLFGGAIDEDFWMDLEDVLIAGDVGLETTETLLDEMRAYHARCRCEGKELLRHFKSELIKRLDGIPRMGAPLQSGENGLSVILMVGVNGSGKTTTTGKLAWLYKESGKKVIVAAADTFRAAAIEQLQVWGEKSGIRVIAQKQGSDSAAVVFDAITAARSSKADVLIVDTAGRLQSKHNLMEELGKIYRVIEREVGKEHVESILVLDSVIGQNAFRQAEVFNEAARLTGVVLAKYDNTAKGGIVLSIADKLRLPIRYIGLGEAPEDLKLFDAEEFVEALFGEAAPEN